MSGLPEVQEITRWQFKPGDRLIAIVDRDAGTISNESAAIVRAHLRASLNLPDDFPIAIATSDWHFAVIGESE